MAIMAIHHPLAFTFGLLGNIVSFMVYLAPLPTFYRIYKKKSTEGFQSVPYVVALFSAMLWIYYALLKIDAYLLITINIVGCVIETIYVAMYMIYAPKKTKIFTLMLILLLNVGAFGLILFTTLFFAKGTKRVAILGWVCAIFTRLVIRTKSVEFMPFSLSFFLTINAVMWFSYGLLLKDLFIALPNTLGFLFGTGQMVLYIIYRDMNKVLAEQKMNTVDMQMESTEINKGKSNKPVEQDACDV